MISNSSGLNPADPNSKFAYNSVPNTEYFSISSKQSGNSYQPRL